MEEGAYDQVMPQMEPEMAPPMDDMDEYEYDSALMEEEGEEY